MNDTIPPKVKWFIVVAETDDEFACVYINTQPRYQVRKGLLVAQLAISSIDCPFLSHDSFVDCAIFHEKSRREIELALRQNPHVFKGIVPPTVLNRIMVLILHADSIEEIDKKKYGLIK